MVHTAPLQDAGFSGDGFGIFQPPTQQGFQFVAIWLDEKRPRLDCESQRLVMGVHHCAPSPRRDAPDQICIQFGRDTILRGAGEHAETLAGLLLESLQQVVEL